MRISFSSVQTFNLHSLVTLHGTEYRAQSRQSAKRFSSRWNWDSPTPLAAGECATPPMVRGGGHTRLRLKGWGSPNSNEGTYTVVLYIYKYFVVPSIYVEKTHKLYINV